MRIVVFFMKHFFIKKKNLKKGLTNVLIISFLLLGVIFSFLVLISTLNIFVNRFNYEYLYGSFYVADSYIVRFSTSTSGKLIIKTVPYNLIDNVINYGSVSLNNNLINANIYTVDNNYRQLRFYINYNGVISNYYQVDKVIVY